MNPLKADSCLQCREQEEVTDLKQGKDPEHHCWLQWRKPYGRNCRQLPGAESVPQLATVKEKEDLNSITTGD